MPPFFHQGWSPPHAGHHHARAKGLPLTGASLPVPEKPITPSKPAAGAASGKLSGYARGRKGRQRDPAGAASPGPRLGHGGSAEAKEQQLTFSCKTPPRSLRRELIMTVAAREQFLSGSASPSNMASRRLISWSGGTRFPIT